jgi:hypothetical protein
MHREKAGTFTNLPLRQGGSTKVGCGRSNGNQADRCQPSLRDAPMKVPTKHRYFNRDMTRRTMIFGTGASLLCAPIVGRLPIERASAGFCQRLMYQSLASDLEAGHMSTILNGKLVPESEARLKVAQARAKGWLPN